MTLIVPEFIPGLELSGQYYWEAVRPILDADYPDLAHSAGLIGASSEVLADHSRAKAAGAGVGGGLP